MSKNYFGGENGHFQPILGHQRSLERILGQTQSFTTKRVFRLGTAQNGDITPSENAIFLKNATF